jgi:5-methylcytosine-specific restriction endonuclease McrA
MSSVRPRRPRLRLDRCSYETLRGQVLRRDVWRCQFCGSLRNLEVHHMQTRSLLGDDAEENLITLCARCHQQFIYKLPSDQLPKFHQRALRCPAFTRA